jgi:hypothetical protein
VIATGWTDVQNVGFAQSPDNGIAQPRVTIDLGGLYDVSRVDVWSMGAFGEGDNESVSISSSTDGVSFSAPVVVNAIVWTASGPGDATTWAVDVSSLPAGQFYQLEFFDTDQWMMLNEIELKGVLSGGGGGDDFATWIGGYTLTDTSFNGDDDGDGFGNGLEGLMGSDPSASNAGLTQASKSGNMFTFTHPNPDSGDVLTDVTGSYEWSLDVANWNASGATVSGTTVNISALADTPDPNVTTVTCTIPDAVPAKIFVRLVATQD